MSNVRDGTKNKVYTLLLKWINNKPAVSFSIVGPSKGEIYEAVDSFNKFVCHNKVPDPWNFNTFCYCVGTVIQNQTLVDLIIEQDLDQTNNWLEVAKQDTGLNVNQINSIYLPVHSTWHEDKWNIVVYQKYHYTYNSTGGGVGGMANDNGF